MPLQDEVDQDHVVKFINFLYKDRTNFSTVGRIGRGKSSARQAQYLLTKYVFTKIYNSWRELGKRELELRAEQFNRALDVVAKEKKLTPEVVANNRASVFAPCGNPRCAKWETTKIKEFKLCKRCTKCAWCSETCQKAHWKMGHKKECGR